MGLDFRADCFTLDYVLNFAKLLLLIAAATSASAIPIQFTAKPSDNLGWWTATINGVPNQQLLCDDWFHLTPAPPTGTFDFLVSDLSVADPLHNARFKTPPAGAEYSDYMIRYRAAALLVAQLVGALPKFSPLPISDYQWALWDLFDDHRDQITVTSAQAAIRQNAYDTAKNSAPASLQYLYDRLVVYTPTSAYVGALNPQEFLGWTPVPEPGHALGLFVALGAGWMVRRRRKA